MSDIFDGDRLERHRAFFAMEPVSRLLVGCNIGFYMHEQFPRLCAALPKGPVAPEDIRVDLFVEDCENLYRAYRQLGDDYGFVGGPFVYVPWMEAIMGCSIHVSETSMWAEPVIEDWDTWHWERPVLSLSPWAQKLLELMDAAVEHSGGRYPVSPTLMRGPADMLSALRGATTFPLDLYDYPQEVRRAANLCADVWIEVGQAQLARVPASSSGYLIGCHGLRTWVPEKAIWLQEDAAALLSPRLYREFFLPADARIASEFPCVAFHLHGTAIWAIDDLLTVPGIDVIELNYDSAEVDLEEAFAGWKKIQEQKPLVIWSQFSGDDYWPWLERVLAELSLQGLAIQATVSNVEEGIAITNRIMG